MPSVLKPVIILFFIFLFQQLSGGYVVIFYAVYVFKMVGGNFGSGFDEYDALIFLGLIRYVVLYTYTNIIPIRLWIWRMVSSGLLRRVALVRTDVSEECITSFIKVARMGNLGTMLPVTSNRSRL
jgi:hypothetical protein